MGSNCAFDGPSHKQQALRPFVADADEALRLKALCLEPPRFRVHGVHGAASQHKASHKETVAESAHRVNPENKTPVG
eukprot:Skav228121  [mRNA]  locus=scaffold1220:143749:144416:+ [translate_table: standard]